MSQTKSNILPLSLAGPGNQYCGIKEGLIIASVLGFDLTLPVVVPHGTIRSDSRPFYTFAETFDEEHFIQVCRDLLGVGVRHFEEVRPEIAQGHYHSVMMKWDDPSIRQAEEYLGHFQRAMAMPDSCLTVDVPTPARSYLNSPGAIRQWYQLLSAELDSGAGLCLALVGLFNNLKLGGINSDTSGSVCNKNHCLNCPPNPEFEDIYARVNKAFRFSRRIREAGDRFISERFGDREFLGFHLRICDLPRNRSFKECYSGYAEQEVKEGLRRYAERFGIREEDVFLAAPPQLFSAVSDLSEFRKEKVNVFVNDGGDPYFNSLIEQYICSRAGVFVRSYTNTPDVARKAHTRSSWSELVEGVRRAEDRWNCFTIDDEIAAVCSSRKTHGRKFPPNDTNKPPVSMRLERSQRREDVVYSSSMEEGDFVPYFYIENEGRKLDIQVKAGRYLLLVFASDEVGETELQKAVKSRPVVPIFFICRSEPEISHQNLFHDRDVFDLFSGKGAGFTAYYCSKNLKILKKMVGEDFSSIASALPDAGRVDVVSPPPVLVVPNVISQELADRLIAYADGHEEDAFKNRSDYKSRSHIAPSKDLIRELDEKLSKSLLPEISKVFYSDISHRETYKICAYDAEHKGAFGMHRDTISPYLHRRFAMSLVLNDDYEAGGVCFPEYSDEVVSAPKLAAVIFPGSLYHQVKEIVGGTRYVIISFFFTEMEAALKPDLERYRWTVVRDTCNLAINKLTPDYQQSPTGADEPVDVEQERDRLESKRVVSAADSQHKSFKEPAEACKIIEW